MTGAPGRTRRVGSLDAGRRGLEERYGAMLGANPRPVVRYGDAGSNPVLKLVV